VFIDKDFTDAAAAGVIADFVENPYVQNLDSKDWQTALSPLAAQVASLRVREASLGDGKFSAAFNRTGDLPNSDTLRADLVLTMIAANKGYDGTNILIRDVIIPDLFLEETHDSLARVHFQDCIVVQLELAPEGDLRGWPRFSSCYFGVVNGRTSVDDMPGAIFIDCVYEEFENTACTTAEILNLGLPLTSKVLLTLLKKLFDQRGSGRRESALFRGLDARSRELVPEALGLLKKHRFVIRSRQGDQAIWLPAKGSDHRRRALSMLAAPNGSSDPLLIESIRM
jgi:hypothetical protein